LTTKILPLFFRGIKTFCKKINIKKIKKEKKKKKEALLILIISLWIYFGYVYVGKEYLFWVGVCGISLNGSSSYLSRQAGS
jgi:hypothetical protein